MSLAFVDGRDYQPSSDQPVAASATKISAISAMTDIPPDPEWHDEAVLLAELATLNQRIAQYVTRMLDADAKRDEPVSSADEAALGQALVELGKRLRDRSEHQPSAEAATPADDQVE